MIDDGMYPTLPPREAIEAAIEVLIAVRDAMDLDPDLEDSETAGPHIDARGRFHGDAPSQDEDCEPSGDELDTSYTEWHTRSRKAGATEQFDRAGLEDDEHDDPDTGVEDHPRGFDPESDFGAEELGEEEHRAIPRYGFDQTEHIGLYNPPVQVRPS